MAGYTATAVPFRAEMMKERGGRGGGRKEREACYLNDSIVWIGDPKQSEWAKTLASPLLQVICAREGG